MGYFVYYWDGLRYDSNTRFEEFASKAEAMKFINALVAYLPADERQAVTSRERCTLIEGRALDLELINDPDAVRVKRDDDVRFTPVATEDIPAGSPVELSGDCRSMWRTDDDPDVEPEYVAVDSFAKGEAAIYDLETGEMRKIRRIN